MRVGKRRVPATYEKGFMGAEVEVSVTNASRRPIVVRDVRLMLSGAYGAPVESSVLGEQSDPSLPATLDPGAQRQWYVKGYDQSWTRSRFLRRSASLFEGCGFVLSKEADLPKRSYWRFGASNRYQSTPLPGRPAGSSGSRSTSTTRVLPSRS